MKFRNVLVVDDCAITRRRIVKELSALGYLVRTASDGLAALRQMRELCPDYVVTDWQMPNIQGDVLCRCIRAETTPHYVYIILMTAHSKELNIVQGLGAGADDYISKPVDVRELLARMESGGRVLELDRRLTHMAQHDPLTGSLNRLNLISSLNSELELCRRREKPLSVIMVDLDHFKRVNDEFGHLVGDAVLLNISELLRKQFRNSDYVCRYGGEEFCIVLPGSHEAGAAACAERCRLEMEVLDVSGLPSSYRATASFGVAAAASDEELTPAQLVERSDLALRGAKQQGRNQVLRYSTMEFGGVSTEQPPVIVPPIQIDVVENTPSTNFGSAD